MPPPIAEDDLWRDVLEEQATSGEINIPYVVRVYRESVPERPLIRLMQDIEERVAIYHNILEELKRSSGVTDSASTGLRQRFEGLGLVPEGHLPNPFPWEAAGFALSMLRKFGSALLRLAAEYAIELKKELKISVDVKFNINVNLSLPPSASFGIQADTDE